jgi:hypothetical protein
MELLGILLFSITFYFIGKYIERLKWNKLIYGGKIPKPKQ